MANFEQAIPNFYVGSYPESFQEGIDYDVSINVTDTPGAVLGEYPAKHHFWFPVNECGKWDYASFYGTKRVLDALWTQEKPVLVHCSAGVYRSVIVASSYLYSIGRLDEYQHGKEVFERFLGSKRCPPGLCHFLNKMNEYPTYCIGGVLTECKLYCFEKQWREWETYVVNSAK